MENMYDVSVIPTLYAKIGALTVRSEMLAAHNQELIAEIRRLNELLPEGATPVDITTLTEEEQAAIANPTPAQGPSQEDLVKQLEADFLVAKRDENQDLMNELDERHERVKNAADDAAALVEYERRDAAPVE